MPFCVCIVVPGRVELPTSTLSVWRSNQLSYRTGRELRRKPWEAPPHLSLHLGILNKTVLEKQGKALSKPSLFSFRCFCLALQKGGVPAAPSGTATLLRLSPNYQFRPRPLLTVTDFRRPRLSWLDGRCVQGPGTYSPRHG